MSNKANEYKSSNKSNKQIIRLLVAPILAVIGSSMEKESVPSVSEIFYQICLSAKAKIKDY